MIFNSFHPNRIKVPLTPPLVACMILVQRQSFKLPVSSPSSVAAAETDKSLAGSTLQPPEICWLNLAFCEDQLSFKVNHDSGQWSSIFYMMDKLNFKNRRGLYPLRYRLSEFLLPLVSLTCSSNVMLPRCRMPATVLQMKFCCSAVNPDPASALASRWKSAWSSTIGSLAKPDLRVWKLRFIVQGKLDEIKI